MKVGFLIHSLEAPSARYRVLQYLPYLKEQGVEVSLYFYEKGWADKLKFFDALNQHDIFYIHKKLFTPIEFWYVHKKAFRMVFDLDDALMYRSSGEKNPYSFTRRMKFAYMMKRVHCVIPGNQFLKSEVLPYNRNVKVIPTSIELSRYRLKEDYHSKGSITIGWIGTSSTLKYLESLIPIFTKVYQQYPQVQIKIVCNQFIDCSTLPLIKKSWSSEEEIEDLMSFDIGVMPLFNDLWSQGKCGLKILQYFSVGLPVVCTPVGINRDMVEDGVNGFWAKNEEEWKDRLLRLIYDEGLRRKMGLKGRETVEKAYSIEVNAPRLLEVLRRVLSN
jgi:glycosyltransferase involved in cell wall biosynthesis